MTWNLRRHTNCCVTTRMFDSWKWNIFFNKVECLTLSMLLLIVFTISFYFFTKLTWKNGVRIIHGRALYTGVYGNHWGCEIKPWQWPLSVPTSRTYHFTTFIHISLQSAFEHLHTERRLYTPFSKNVIGRRSGIWNLRLKIIEGCRL